MRRPPAPPAAWPGSRPQETGGKAAARRALTRRLLGLGPGGGGGGVVFFVKGQVWEKADCPEHHLLLGQASYFFVSYLRIFVGS